MRNVRFIGLDVHAETIAVAAAEPGGEVRSLGVIPNPGTFTAPVPMPAYPASTGAVGEAWTLDTTGTAPFSRSKASLKEGGRLLMVLGGLPDMLQIPWVSMTSSKKIIAGPAAEQGEDLRFLAKVAEAGEFDELRQEFLLQGIEDFVACAILVQLRERRAAQTGDVVRTDAADARCADDTVEA